MSAYADDRYAADQSLLPVAADGSGTGATPSRADSKRRTRCCRLAVASAVTTTLITLGMLYWMGWFTHNASEPPTCPATGNSSNHTASGWYCTEPHSDYRFPTHVAPLAFHASSSNASAGIQGGNFGPEGGDATGPQFRESCGIEAGSSSDSCHVMVGLSMFFSKGTPYGAFVGGLYVEPEPARKALAAYKDRDASKVLDAALPGILSSGLFETTMRWEAAFYHIPLPAMPLSMLKAEYEPLLVANWPKNTSATAAERTALVDEMFKVCYPVSWIHKQDVILVHWHAHHGSGDSKGDAISCSYAGMPYKTITMAKTSQLAYAMQNYVLLDGGNQMVSLTPFLWKWP